MGVMARVSVASTSQPGFVCPDFSSCLPKRERDRKKRKKRYQVSGSRFNPLPRSSGANLPAGNSGTVPVHIPRMDSMASHSTKSITR